MPETFAPFTWIDGTGGGTPITATQLNRLETGLESMDDRAAALESGIYTPVTVTYAASLTLNATLGSLFRVTATGNLALADITGGSDGQLIWLEVEASGADRTVTVAGVTDTVASGTAWVGAFRYKATGDQWRFIGTGGSGGSTTAPRFVTPPVTVTYASSVTLNATLSSVFWCTATGDLVLADITGGADGQEVVFGVEASGADRTVTLGGGSAETVPAGQVWIGTFRYRATGDTWWRTSASGSSGGGGSGTSISGLAALTETTGIEVSGRVVRVGPQNYDATIPTGSPDGAFVVIDGLNDAQDRSVLFRSAGQQQWEIGNPGDKDFHVKRVTGTNEASHTYTDTLIVDYATGKVWVPTSLGIGTIPAERFHVIDLQAAAAALMKVENTATTGSEAAGFVLAGRSKSWTVKTDVGLNGGDNLGISSTTAGYPPRVMMTPTAVGIATDSPGSALDVNGAVTVRGDNGLSPLRIRGLKATTGAPTTGTWAVGDAVMDAVGAWYLCKTAGTPGTWSTSPVRLTQAQYDALGTKDPNTIYLVTP